VAPAAYGGAENIRRSSRRLCVSAVKKAVQKKTGGLAAARKGIRFALIYLTNTEIVTLTVWPPGP
jgi:hypothetical protein